MKFNYSKFVTATIIFTVLPLMMSAQTPIGTSNEGLNIPTPGGIDSPVSIVPTPSPETIAPKKITLKGEGYNGIPWGTTLEDFETEKGITTGMSSNPDSHFGQEDDTYGFGDEIAAITKVPFVTKLGVETTVQFENVPAEFIAVKVESEDLTYIFYKGKLAMVFSLLKAKNYTTYKNKLALKYPFIGNINKQVKYITGSSDSISVECFKRAGTRAFLMKTNMSGLIKLGLLYFSDSKYVLITNDIAKNVNHANAVKSKGENHETQKDLDKIQ